MDVVQELYDNTQTNVEAIKKAKQENKKVRLIIINSIIPKIHEDIIGIEAASAITESLKSEYNSEANDFLQWINKLTTIKTRTKNEIPTACKKMIKIFSNMKEAKAPMEEKKKAKYFLRALPTNYKSKFILDSNITVDSLYNKIKEDLKLWNYFNIGETLLKKNS